MELPEVSLISSWHSPTPKKAREQPDLLALRLGLEQQIALHDLYFLNHTDIPWYHQRLKEGGSSVGDDLSAAQSPLEFAAALKPSDVTVLATALIEFLATNFKGALVGPRPRFTAVATYWPLISLPSGPDDDQLRKKSVAALANSLLLASKLGCHHVEIVAGSAVPDNGLDVVEPDAGLRARNERTQVFCRSLREVFDLVDRAFQPGDRRPAVCLEIEPGEVYLMDQVSRFAELRLALEASNFRWLDRVLLNIDFAHMMLTPGDENLTGSEIQAQAAKREDIMPWIGHMHMSDHARTHAADLCPGTYHFYPHYKPWLDLALDLCEMREARFSGVIAVELEACGDIFEVVRATGKTRRWIAHTARSRERSRMASSHADHDPRLIEGSLLVVDIGNSTACLTEKSPAAIERCVTAICRVVHRHRGSVYSFTGDGVIAVFEGGHFVSAREAAGSALNVVESLPLALEPVMKADPGQVKSAYLRAALHWGQVHVPTGGPLLYQAIGRDVVIACRLCSRVDEFLDEPEGRVKTVASKGWCDVAGKREHSAFRSLDLKGISEEIEADAWFSATQSVAY